ncbi:MAG: CBS domain-containing protein [Methylocystaceae bacterium]
MIQSSNILKFTSLPGGFISKGEGLIKGRRKTEFLERATVAEAMTSRVISFKEDTLLNLAAEVAVQVGHVIYPVINDDNRLCGVVYYENIIRYVRKGGGEIKAGDICHTSYQIIGPNESLKKAMEHMVKGEVGRLVVVEPEEPDLLLGIISRGDVLKFYTDNRDQEEDDHK